MLKVGMAVFTSLHVQKVTKQDSDYVTRLIQKLHVYLTGDIQSDLSHLACEECG